jgi:glutaconate CoA-transferase subunit A
VERIVATEDLVQIAGTELRLRVGRMMVDGIVEAPGGAAFTSCVPEYERDEAAQKEYASTPWEEFAPRWLA